MKIRTKLALWYGLLLTVILISLSVIRHAAHQQILYNQKEYSLKVIANILEATIPRNALSVGAVQRSVARVASDFPDLDLEGILIEVYDPSRTLLYSSSLSETERLPLDDTVWPEGTPRQGHLATAWNPSKTARLRIFTKPVYYQNRLVYLIQVGSSMHDIEANLQNTLWLGLVFVPAAVLLMSLGGWFLTSRALGPLGHFVKTAHRISSGDLSHRIDTPPASPELIELAQAFNTMLARLEASFQNIREFSDNVSHELRIPLSILKGQTELSLRRRRSEEDYRSVLESNLEEIQRMEKIVERLLFLSKAGRGEIALHHTQIDLAGLLDRVRTQFQEAATSKGIRLSVTAEGPVRLRGDEVLLHELLSNLVQNALVFTPSRGEVALSVSRQGNSAQLAVSDTGIGIPEKDLPRIFERFYQADRSRSGQGSGLGLSICKWIVEAHGATIRVHSAVGQGTRFVVKFPL